MMKLVFSILGIILLTTLFLPEAESQGPQDALIKARIRGETERREKSLAQLKEATGELVELTNALSEAVEEADGFTTSAKIVESSDKIEELAKKIENLAKTVKRRAQGR
jgi:NADH dehydrogenase/NADH:ubiquinone oxidoreductase subunit G